MRWEETLARTYQRILRLEDPLTVIVAQQPTDLAAESLQSLLPRGRPRGVVQAQLPHRLLLIYSLNNDALQCL
jgi:hypothetical protein